MKLRAIHAEEVAGGYFYDDQAAIRAGARRDGELYAGTPLTPGFPRVRMPARGLAIGIELEDGALAWGDAISVQYPGIGDRDPPLEPAALAPRLRGELARALAGLDCGRFREADAAARGSLCELGLGHAGLAYGFSQALLAAAARCSGQTMAEVICTEFELPLHLRTVPLLAQTGEARRGNADKMILKRVPVLPHGLINSLETFGARGERFIDYVSWLVARIDALDDGDGYAPTLHFDLYGLAGVVLGGESSALADYLLRVEEAAAPHPVRVETPFLAASRAEQIERFAALREALGARGSALCLVADEWCNTLEDIRAFIAAPACDMVQVKMPDLGSLADSVLAVADCRRAGVGAYLGGSCAETDLSARVSVHVAVATQADVQLAKPGMGVDEGLMIVGNEQVRLLAELRRRHPAAATATAP